MPGYFGIEAGQSAVGDILNWWVEGVCEGDDALHARAVARRRPRWRPASRGSSRSTGTTATARSSSTRASPGSIVGQTLHTTRAEIYRALIEATAFGARAIIERIRDYGVPIDRVVCCGGIAEKNDLFMQIYADVHRPADADRRLAADAGARRGGLGRRDRRRAQPAATTTGPTRRTAMTTLKEKRFAPDPRRRPSTMSCTAIYRELHDAFGGVAGRAGGLGDGR